MKVYGRHGAFTPKKHQADAYRGAVKRQQVTRKARAVSVAAWLEKHKAYANGCRNSVAFYDPLNYVLRFSGCCSTECEADEDGPRKLPVPADL